MRKVTTGNAVGGTDSAKTPPVGLLGGEPRTTTWKLPLSGSFTLSLSGARVPRGIESEPVPAFESPGWSTNGCGPGQSQASVPSQVCADPKVGHWLLLLQSEMQTPGGEGEPWQICPAEQSVAALVQRQMPGLPEQIWVGFGQLPCTPGPPMQPVAQLPPPGVGAQTWPPGQSVLVAKSSHVQCPWNFVMH